MSRPNSYAVSRPVSQAKIDANRRNAQRSTGPRTPSGKAKVALNAMTHGLRATRVVSVEESAEDFGALRDQLAREWRPASVLEVAMVNQIAELLWRRRRVAAVEATVLEGTTVQTRSSGPLSVPRDVTRTLCREMRSANSAVLRTQLYQSRIDRSLHRALAELRRLQIDRQLRDETPLTNEEWGEELGEEREATIENERTNPPFAVTVATADGCDRAGAGT